MFVVVVVADVGDAKLLGRAWKRPIPEDPLGCFTMPAAAAPPPEPAPAAPPPDELVGWPVWLSPPIPGPKAAPAPPPLPVPLAPPPLLITPALAAVDVLSQECAAGGGGPGPRAPGPSLPAPAWAFLLLLLLLSLLPLPPAAPAPALVPAAAACPWSCS